MVAFTCKDHYDIDDLLRIILPRGRGQAPGREQTLEQAPEPQWRGARRDAYERLGSVVYDNIKNNTENQSLVDLVVGEIDQIRENMEKLKASRSPSDAVELL